MLLRVLGGLLVALPAVLCRWPLAAYDACGAAILDGESSVGAAAPKTAVAFDPRGQGRLWLASNQEGRLVSHFLNGTLAQEVPYSTLIGGEGERGGGGVICPGASIARAPCLLFRRGYLDPSGRLLQAQAEYLH